MPGGRACASTCCRIRSSRGRRRRCAPSLATTGPAFSTRWARASEERGVMHPHSEIAGRVDCGPEGCELDWLTSARLEVDDDAVAFQKLATDAGWGDGLPLVPPTEERVRDHLVASGRFPDECLAELPPRNGRCTVEKLAVNAVMAGASAGAMPLLCAAVEAMADPVFNLFALNTTTSCVVPGMVVGEWEERSPWSPLAERRGFAGDAVTVHGCTGTVDVAEIVADNGEDLLEIIGASLAFPGTNAFIGAHHGAEILVCLAPPWADLIARAYSALDDVQERLWTHASLPVERWPKPHREKAVENGRVDDEGLVHLVESPGHMLIMVCGGLGNLHALALHSFGPTRAVTRAF